MSSQDTKHVQSISINRNDTAVAMNRYEGIVDTFV